MSIMEPPDPNSKLHPFRNPSSLRSRFATRFLKSLIKINTLRSPSLVSSSPREILQRRRRIKLAADHSMARAVRSPRAWKRAVLSRTTGQARHRLASRRLKSAAIGRIRPVQMRKPRRNRSRSCGPGEEAGELKKLVPGGEGMNNLESLLEETAHYIKCLSTQVQVMTTILDLCSRA